MQMIVFKEFVVETAHFLPNVPKGHKCANMHGHQYRITLEVKGVVSAMGWVIDYADIKSVFQPIYDKLDHHCLNDFLPNPTCEILAEWIWEKVKPQLPGLRRIHIKETDSSGVIFEGDDSGCGNN